MFCTYSQAVGPTVVDGLHQDGPDAFKAVILHVLLLLHHVVQMSPEFVLHLLYRGCPSIRLVEKILSLFFAVAIGEVEPKEGVRPVR